MAYQLDPGTIMSQGVQGAVSGQPKTIQANLANVPGYQNQIDFYGNLLRQGPSQQQLADFFNTQGFNTNVAGQSFSPAAILQNAMGYGNYVRNAQMQGAQGLQDITRGSQLQAFQPGQGVQTALQAELGNQQAVTTEDMINARAGRAQYGMPDWAQAAGGFIGAGGVPGIRKELGGLFGAGAPSVPGMPGGQGGLPGQGGGMQLGQAQKPPPIDWMKIAQGAGTGMALGGPGGAALGAGFGLFRP